LSSGQTTLGAATQLCHTLVNEISKVELVNLYLGSQHDTLDGSI
jgi:hypothetical protein